MIPFQLHRRIPLVRRPFYQRDTIAAERDTIAVERDTIARELDTLKMELTHQMARASEERKMSRYVPAGESRLTSSLNHPYLLHARNRPSRLTYQPATPLPDVDFLARLASAFRQAMQRPSGELGPIWGSLVGERHREVAELAASDDRAKLGCYLARLGETALSVGPFDSGPEAHEASLKVPEFNQLVSLWVTDRIVSLAEYLGCVQVENPQQGPWGVNAQAPLDELLAKIAKELAIDISPPRYLGSYWGLGSRFGVFTPRTLDCLYAAARAKQILKVSGGNGVVEIGGGVGLAAAYARRVGVERYTVVDLPTVALCQGFVLGEEPDLRLHGEPKTAPVCLAAPWEYAALPRFQPSDLLLNVDSLPEMESQVAISYLVDAKKLGIGLFLSINQESGDEVGGWSQGKVSALAGAAGGYQLLSRHRSWMRPGYVEELYRIG